MNKPSKVSSLRLSRNYSNMAHFVAVNPDASEAFRKTKVVVQCFYDRKTKTVDVEFTQEHRPTHIVSVNTKTSAIGCWVYAITSIGGLSHNWDESVLELVKVIRSFALTIKR